MEAEPKMDIPDFDFPMTPNFKQWRVIRWDDPVPQSRKERLSGFFENHIFGVICSAIILLYLFCWGFLAVKILQSDNYDRRLLFAVSFYYSALMLAVSLNIIKN